jgi:hypothetical protein
MITKQRSFEIKRCLILLVLIFWTRFAFAQESQTAVLEPLLNPAYAKENLQTSYALKVAQLTINAIYAYKQKFKSRPLRESDVNWFTQELLRHGEDHLIQAVHYVPEQSLTVVMHDNKSVAPLLRKTKLVITYYPDANKWKINPDFPTIAATRPDSLLADLGLTLISEYCDEDVTSTASDLPDSEWCPLWLLHVMPLP